MARPTCPPCNRAAIHYWALGGRHDRSTPLADPPMIHYCGSPQGRRPEETGIHGCTLVQVDAQRQTRTSLIPTDAVRWINERVAVDETTSREILEARLHDICTHSWKHSPLASRERGRG